MHIYKQLNVFCTHDTFTLKYLSIILKLIQLGIYFTDMFFVEIFSHRYMCGKLDFDQINAI